VFSANFSIISVMHHALNSIKSMFSDYHWVDTAAVELWVPKGIILPRVSILALTWFIRYIYVQKLQFLNYVMY